MDSRLPAIIQPPLVREHRLYQADWLMRFYHFNVDEIVDNDNSDLDLEIDPKLSYALRNTWMFPVDINKADYETILRVPWIGVKSAMMIVRARRFGKLTSENLKKFGVVLKRAKYFITCNQLPAPKDILPLNLRNLLLDKHPVTAQFNTTQLSLF